MTGAALTLECGVAQTRAAFLRGDEVLRFAFGPALGDETLPRPPRRGDLFLGRVGRAVKPLGGAFVDIGDRRDGFLQVKKSQTPPPEGAAVVVEVRRPSIARKGAVLQIVDRAAPRHASPPTRLNNVENAAADVVAELGLQKLDKVLVNNAEAIGALQSARLPSLLDADLKVVESPFEVLGVEEALERAFARDVVLAGGARMVIDETEAMTVVDIDSGGLAGKGTGRVNDQTNMLAAEHLFAELSRRRIGGRLIVDFLPPSTADRRQALIDLVKKKSRNAGGWRIGKLTTDGVLDATAPREAMSLLEMATETAGPDWPRPGRRLTMDWIAKHFFHQLERRMCAAKSARFSAACARDLADYLDLRPQWKERLAARYGARCAFEIDDRLEDRRFVVTEI